MATGVIKAGACGFTINVKAESGDNHKVKLEITSDCPNYQKIAAELQEVDAFQEIFNKLHMGKVYETFAKYSPHPSCPGVSGIMKSIEVAASLALPQNASISVTRE
ncbi:hypothetical protein Desor_1654 [Desulfosporosinus orientis DSM 765]|uniref:Uncharacterized protein n=1 Tax=Desulfosporosinus orientis (strain ATCC 19365 / DSM 765 / NCIMB 8382 / VKM B-1628 / Singapore I) TaxID=768706 RepID=G7WEW9_DESOD|nr:hypothetical protein [Desulfosporosinus orientis]AET67298.1 hypothetical protein Desor_1654 [Desulfosporosinus orientis DSM 765]